MLEYGLGEYMEYKIITVGVVLILIMLEYGLGALHGQGRHKAHPQAVLILIMLEYGLGAS